ncbi:MAG: cupin domain-containing protein [Natronomonas sp.]
MQRIDIEDVDDWMGPATVKRPLGEALGTEAMAINYYELDPGESFAFGYHAHEGQEEVFYVIDGEVVFETDDGDLFVGADQAVYVPPGEFQRGFNETDERVRAIAIGAPAESGETTILRVCADCGERTEQEIEPTPDRDALVTICVDCGAETGHFD